MNIPDFRETKDRSSILPSAGMLEMLKMGSAIRAQSINVQYVTVGNQGNIAAPATRSLFSTPKRVLQLLSLLVVSILTLNARGQVDPSSVNGAVDEAYVAYNGNTDYLLPSIFTNNASLLPGPFSTPLVCSDAGAAMSDTFAISNVSNGGAEISLSGSNSVNGVAPGYDSNDYGLIVMGNFTITEPTSFSISMAYSGSAVGSPDNSGADLADITFNNNGIFLGRIYSPESEGPSDSNPYVQDGILAPGPYSFQFAMSMINSSANAGIFDAGTIDLQLGVVPEPSTWAMTAAGATLLFAFRKRRRS